MPSALVHEYQAQQLKNPCQEEQAEQRQQSLQRVSITLCMAASMRDGTLSRSGGLQASKQ